MPDNDNTRTHQPGDHDATRTGAGAPDPEATLVKPRDQSASLAPDSGLAVPGFAIEDEIGRGGMGVVYRAKQAGLNRTVALKMLLAGPFADPSLRARFLLEAESVAALEHPHIVKVHAFGEHGGHPYLAMEFLPGGTLADRVKTNGPLPAAAATELVAKLADAVAHAHSRGVVHRDIKPLNVMFAADGQPRLTDFGLAKVGRADQNLSVTGQVLGTPAYMSPEQAAGKVHEVGTAADVYALGAVLYDLLTGRPPFKGDSAAVTLQKVLADEPTRLRRLNAAIPRDLETICLKCLDKQPARRYPTAQALADDLLRYARNEPISVRDGSAARMVLPWLRDSLHKDILARHGRAWIWQAGIIFVVMAVTNVLTWYGCEAASVYIALWVGGLVVWAVPGWYYVVRERREWSPVERQLRQLVTIWIGTCGLFLLCTFLTGLDPMRVLSLWLLLTSVTVGAAVVILGGTFYPLAVLCAFAAIVTAAAPTVGPIVFGAACAIGLVAAGWSHTRADKEE